MTTAAPVQAIAGVSAGQERILETVYPSVAASGLGRTIGQWMESIPTRIMGVKLSYILLGGLLAPLGLALYLLSKVLGNKYCITNRSVEIHPSVGDQLVAKVALSDVADVRIDVQAGQEFHRAGDIVLVNSRDERVLTLEGVAWPERVRHLILEARAARLSSDAALTRINSRQ